GDPGAAPAGQPLAAPAGGVAAGGGGQHREPDGVLVAHDRAAGRPGRAAGTGRQPAGRADRGVVGSAPVLGGGAGAGAGGAGGGVRTVRAPRAGTSGRAAPRPVSRRRRTRSWCGQRNRCRSRGRNPPPGRHWLSVTTRGSTRGSTRASSGGSGGAGQSPGSGPWPRKTR